MNEMIQDVDGRHAITLLGIAVLLFGVMPGVVVRLAVRAYPPEDRTRARLIGDIYAPECPVWKRPFMAAQAVEVCFSEGLPLRVKPWVERSSIAAQRRLRAAARSAVVIWTAVVIGMRVVVGVAAGVCAVLFAGRLTIDVVGLTPYAAVSDPLVLPINCFGLASIAATAFWRGRSRLTPGRFACIGIGLMGVCMYVFPDPQTAPADSTHTLSILWISADCVCLGLLAFAYRFLDLHDSAGASAIHAPAIQG